MMTVANALTFLRVLLVPFVVLFVYLDYFWVASALFLLASITDYLDGYIAKCYGETSVLGVVMDPVADKLLVIIVSFALAHCGRLHSLWHALPLLVIIFREIWVLGVRHYVSSLQCEGIPVMPLARVKSAFQMLAMLLLLLPVPQNASLHSALFWLSSAVLMIAAILTGVTGAFYTYQGYCCLHKAGGGN